MTICASVKVRDGLVLATDSMTQIQMLLANGQMGVVKTYSNATKLFQVASLPIGVMSWGIGNIGDRSIQGLMGDFKPAPRTKSIRTVVRAIYSYFKSAYDSQFSDVGAGQAPELGIFVAGYTPGRPFAEEWEFVLPSYDRAAPVRSPDTFGASWRGIVMPFSRLYMGYDPRLRQKLRDAGHNDQAINDILSGFAMNVVYDGMPMQDAANFAAYIVRTTIAAATFEAGAPTCGGPLQVASIHPHRSFEWVTRPSLNVEND